MTEPAGSVAGISPNVGVGVGVVSDVVLDAAVEVLDVVLDATVAVLDATVEVGTLDEPWLVGSGATVSAFALVVAFPEPELHAVPVINRTTMNRADDNVAIDGARTEYACISTSCFHNVKE